MSERKNIYAWEKIANVKVGPKNDIVVLQFRGADCGYDLSPCFTQKDVGEIALERGDSELSVPRRASPASSKAIGSRQDDKDKKKLTGGGDSAV